VRNPARFKRLIQKCHEPRPDKRPGSVDEILSDSPESKNHLPRFLPVAVMSDFMSVPEGPKQLSIYAGACPRRIAGLPALCAVHSDRVF